MARNNTISATWTVTAGDGSDAVTASRGTTSFTSGDAVVINGTAPNTTAQTWTVEDFLGSGVSANALYVENRDDTHNLTVTVNDGADNDFTIPPNGVWMMRCTNAIASVSVLCPDAGQTTEYTLGFAE